MSVGLVAEHVGSAGVDDAAGGGGAVVDLATTTGALVGATLETVAVDLGGTGVAAATKVAVAGSGVEVTGT